MAVTYSWAVTQMTKKPQVNDATDVVVHVRWNLTGTESTTGTTGNFPGATPFELDPDNTGSFVAFEDLTEEIVIGWLENVVVDDYWNHVTERIQHQIDEIDDPAEELSEEALPWSTGSVTPTPETGSAE
jgi:hypothetical protein